MKLAMKLLILSKSILGGSRFQIQGSGDDDTRLVTDFRTDFCPKLERVRKAYIFLTRRSFPLIAIQVRRGLPHSPEEQTGWVLGSSGLAATFSLIDLFIMDNERIEQQTVLTKL